MCWASFLQGDVNIKVPCALCECLHLCEHPVDLNNLLNILKTELCFTFFRKTSMKDSFVLDCYTMKMTNSIISNNCNAVFTNENS